MRHRCQAVIFDMDGVLVNSEPVYMAIERELFASVGAVVTEEEHHRFVGAPAAALWQFAAQRATQPCTVDALERQSRQRINRWLADSAPLEPMPGVVALLERLSAADVPCAVASSSALSTIEAMLRRLGVRHRFDVVVSGEEVTHGKPAPDIFLETARRLGVAPQECVVLEDARNGVLAANAAGMYCCAIRNPDSGNQDLSAADCIVTSLIEIPPPLIERL